MGGKSQGSWSKIACELIFGKLCVISGFVIEELQ